jgi:hypothetical protein
MKIKWMNDSPRSLINEFGQSPCKRVRVEIPNHPLPDEPHLTDWYHYEKNWAHLQAILPQLNIPIKKDISKSPIYSDVVNQGQSFDEEKFGSRFVLQKPNSFSFTIHQHPCGALPVLLTEHRQDFENLFRLITAKSEPIPINPSINATFISGFTNWNRLNKYKEQWSQENSNDFFGMGWGNELKRIVRDEPWRFKDSFILMMKSNYSCVSVSELQLNISEEEWLERSAILRMEHEFTHYGIKRIFGVMRTHLWDEVVADYMGIVQALGEFRGAWFLRFLGVDPEQGLRSDGRIHHYIKNIAPDLIPVLPLFLSDIAKGLENIYQKTHQKMSHLELLLFLSELSLLEMAEQ